MTHLNSPDSLAERLGVPKTTLSYWRTRGEGPKFLRVGRHIRYTEQDIEDYLADCASRGRPSFHPHGDSR